MENLGQPIMYLNSEDFNAFMKQAYNDYAEVIKKLDIKLE